MGAPAGSRWASSTRTARASFLAVAGLLVAVSLSRVFSLVALDSCRQVAGGGPTDPADVLIGLLAATGAVLSAWLGLGTVAAALSALPGWLGLMSAAVAQRVAPAVLRRVVTFALGTTLTAGSIPAAAVADQVPPPGSTPSAVVQAPDPGPRPTPLPLAGPVSGAATDAAPRATDPAFRPTTAPPRPALRRDLGPLGTSPKPGTTVEESVVVRRGDTLWHIAARHLGPGATVAEIAHEWPKWHAANRAVIGANPDLIQPGQRLAPPEGAVS